ncbi:MAG: hypothetical protein M3Q19_03395 [Pseudomonadota bacterium]|nr:hypothetical protein [Pseudomonadota bacterium]
MRKLKLVGAVALISASSPALACELDGMGGHRFFAFANMVRGGPQETTAPNADFQDPASGPKQEERGPSKRASTDDQAEEDGKSDESSKPSSKQTTAPNDGPSDGAMFR